jgi:hypothetical protein
VPLVEWPRLVVAGFEPQFVAAQGLAPLFERGEQLRPDARTGVLGFHEKLFELSQAADSHATRNPHGRTTLCDEYDLLS